MGFHDHIIHLFDICNVERRLIRILNPFLSGFRIANPEQGLLKSDKAVADIYSFDIVQFSKNYNFPTGFFFVSRMLNTFPFTVT